MKYLGGILFLILLSGCNNGGGGSGKVNPGRISNDQVAREFIKSSQTSMEPEFKIQNTELDELEKEGFISSEEKKQLVESI